ncbi:cytochrome c [Pseudorhodobacter turbinis]|uniref:Cytochrome c n=1 Tax=Pseudorhodobacter turbinis TaxID=2500533 RepID=A0A4P8EFA5_9RHOB|nr:cytochrome c [Pseudorhodobacter turbinis]QCO55538.1 cytochrome c [Pseudorhodobacter turbinis]
MFKNKILGAIALSSLGAAALAHNGATGVVMERMTGMSAMRDVMKSLAPIMQGQVPYDEWTVRDAASVLQSHAGDNMARLFPKEPIPASSYAKPEIWSEWGRFETLSEELRLYAEGLDIAAANGLNVPAPVAVPDVPTAEIVDMDVVTMPEDMPPPAFTVEELMGLVSRADKSPPTIAAAKGYGQFTAIDFKLMAADDVFERISQTCASCHSLFRKGN